MLKTEKFIEKANKVHNNKYGYKEVTYIKQNLKVKIFCKICREYFEQTPMHHLLGRGCRKCANIERGKNKRLTTKEFIDKSRIIHQNKYEYNKTNYVTGSLKVKIYCNSCKEYFEQIAGSHLSGYGCKKCGDKKGFTTEVFVKRAKEIHHNKYDYKDIIYLGNRKKVKIYCNSCKEYFWQKPLYHLDGKGCNKCVRKNQILTTEEFIKRAKKVHEDKYNYDKTNYIKAKIPVTIFCKKCNEYFEQTPTCHLIGNGCNVCGGSNRLTTEDFKKRSEKEHNGKYGYDKVNYVNAHVKVEIFCKKCNQYFKQTPASHLMNGNGCPKCVKNNKLTTEEFIKRSKKNHKKIYSYDEVKYVNICTKVKIFCKKCNKYFKQIPMNHLRGVGCPVCGGHNRLTTEDFKKRSEKLHCSKYRYDKVNYVNAHIKVEIFCKKCNNYFQQTPRSHLVGSGCPICRHKNEKEVGILLEKYFKPLEYTINRQKKIYEYIGIDIEPPPP